MKIKAKIYFISDIKESVKTGDYYSSGKSYPVFINKDGVAIKKEAAEIIKGKVQTEKKFVELLAPRFDGNMALASVMLDTCKTKGAYVEADDSFVFNQFLLKPRNFPKPYRHALIVSLNHFIKVADDNADMVYLMTGIVQAYPLKISRWNLFRVKNARGDYLMNKRPIEFWGLVILVASFLIDIVVRLADYFC